MERWRATPVVSLEDQDLFGQKYVAAPAKELTLKDIPLWRTSHDVSQGNLRHWSSRQ